MKEYLKTLGIALGIFLLLLIVLSITGNSIGDNTNDFANQHIKFIEYIRNLIFSTGDFAPQLNMNYGLGQSYVTMYYYGMYNPFIMASLVLGPFLQIKYVMYVIYSLIISLTAVSSHALARLNKFSHYQSRIISLLTTFSGALLFNFGFHVMYIYYYPFMILSLVALHYLVQKDKPYFYSLALSMVFYTNFFFAPIVSIIQFLYFLGLAVDENKNIVSETIKFIKAYILAILIGSLILIPTFFFAIQGVRNGNATFNSVLFGDYNLIMECLLSNRSISGIGVVAILAPVYGLTIWKKKSYFFPTCFLALMLVFDKIVFLLNLNMYNELKHFIYFIPILWLIMGQYIFKEKSTYKRGLISIITLVLISLASNEAVPVASKVVIVIELLMFNLLSYKSKEKIITSVYVGLIIILTCFLTLNVVNSDSYKNATLVTESDSAIKDLSEEMIVSPYRYSEDGLNELSVITSFNPNIYTSLLNSNYQNFINEFLELEKARPLRVTNDSVFNNYFIQNYLGIKNGLSETDINPMVYGVSNKDVFGISELSNSEIDQRLQMINEGVFVHDSKNSYKAAYKPELVYEKNDDFSIKRGIYNDKIPLSKNFLNRGVYVIKVDTDLESRDLKMEQISINGHTNEFLMNDFYGKNINDEGTYILNQNGKVNSLNVQVDTSLNFDEPITYSNLQVYYYPEDKITDNRFETFKPENFKVKMSHYYSFDIKQEEDGYLATTIPYDPNFKIVIDGKSSEIEKINGTFLGAKLDAGNHHIKIEYKIKGFSLSIGLSLVGLATVLYMIIKRK